MVLRRSRAEQLVAFPNLNKPAPAQTHWHVATAAAAAGQHLSGLTV
jgi:hypothetical protein